MAEYVIAFDTKKKTLTVKKDGKEIPNVVCAEICRADYYGYGYGGEGGDDEDFRLAVTQMRNDETEDEKEMIRTVANRNGDLVPDSGHPLTAGQMRAAAAERNIFEKATKDVVEFFKEGY